MRRHHYFDMSNYPSLADTRFTAIRANVPNISSLSLPGEISQRWRTRDRFPPSLQSGEALRELINILTALPNLRKLSLPSALHLDLGMNGGYSGSALGRPLGREDIVEDAEATALAGEIVIGLLPQLEELTIGVQSANITRDNDDGSGAASLTWPWTGSMDDYVNMNTEECSDPWETGHLPDMHWVNYKWDGEMGCGGSSAVIIASFVWDRSQSRHDSATLPTLSWLHLSLCITVSLY